LNKSFKVSFLFSLALIILISFSFTHVVKAASTSQATVTVNTLNVRNGAGTEYKVIGHLKKGDKITVFSKSGWSEFTFNQKKAYVATKFLKFDTPKTVVAKIEKVTTQTDAELVYPQISGLSTKSVQDMINNTLRNHIKNSMKNKQAMLVDFEEWKKEYDGEHPELELAWEYQTSYGVDYNKNKTLSIIMYDYQYTGGAHGQGVAETFNFSLSTGKRIFIEDVLKNSNNYIKVQRDAYNTMINSKDQFFNVRSLDDVSIDKHTQFVYADGGIKLVFQQYEVAPYAAGFPKVNIPYTIYK
jgi:uncharacterized protein YgiM (DUF1202 family)